MARPLRIEYPGAIHHMMSRGNRRRSVFEDERDYQRLLQGPEQTVGRFGWDLLSFVLMPNHFHLFLRTPQPNLSRGMQYLVSGTPSGIGDRATSPKAALVEDESYFWTVSRYVHLNPVRGKRPLAAHPAQAIPAMPGRRDCVGWVAYEAIYAAWQGEMGGSHPEAAYRRFVEEGLGAREEHGDLNRGDRKHRFVSREASGDISILVTLTISTSSALPFSSVLASRIPRFPAKTCDGMRPLAIGLSSAKMKVAKGLHGFT